MLRNRKVKWWRDSSVQKCCGEEASRQTRDKEVKHDIWFLIKMFSWASKLICAAAQYEKENYITTNLTDIGISFWSVPLCLLHVHCKMCPFRRRDSLCQSSNQDVFSPLGSSAFVRERQQCWHRYASLLYSRYDAKIWEVNTIVSNSFSYMSS